MKSRRPSRQLEAPDRMDDPVLVMDASGRIVECNQAARVALGLAADVPLPPIGQLPSPWTGILEQHVGSREGCFEIDLEPGHTFELKIIPVGGSRGPSPERVFLFHDITELKRIQAEERAQRILAEALRDTAEALNSTPDLDVVLENILANVGRVVPVDSANIALLDEQGGLRHVRFHGYKDIRNVKKDMEADGFSLETSQIYQRAYESGEPVIIPDTHADPDWILTSKAEWIRSCAVMPIRTRDKVIGFLVLDSAQVGLYTPDHLERLNAFANQVALAVANARLFTGLEREVRERRQVEGRLRQLSQAVEQSPVSIVITDTRGKIEYVNPRFSELTGYSREEAVGQNPSILKTDKTRSGTHRQLWEAIVSGKTWHGEFVNRKKNGEIYYESATISPILDEKGVIAHFVAVKEDITGRKKNEEELSRANRKLKSRLKAINELKDDLREQAIRDPLTGLHNRRFLEETLEHELARARRASYPVSFIMIDLDCFKQINDLHGHAAGDAVLQRLASLLLSQARGGDILCRYGGEEFLVVLPNANARAAFQVAERWRKSFLGVTYPLQIAQVRVSISCGVSEFPSHGATVDELITRADQAMYQAKQAGRNRTVIWRAE